MSCGAETEAANLLASLTAGLNFTLPVVNLDDVRFRLPSGPGDALYAKLTPLPNEALTTREVGGSGAFDALMASVSAHLKAEFDKGRITGADYTKAYIELTQAAMATGVQFLLGREQAYWQAQQAQASVIQSQVQIETTKAQLVQVQFEAAQSKANYALAAMKLATESIQYCTADYNLKNMLPSQLLLLQAQQNQAQFTLQYMLPAQKVLLDGQDQLIKEQVNVQRAQTADNRTDASPVTGVMGTQKLLYSQQIESYKADSRVKTAKIFADVWSVQKTVDEGLPPPSNFNNTAMDIVFDSLRNSTGLT